MPLFDEEILSLARALGEQLRARRWRLAVAESCTGGLLGALVTAIPGASDYFRGGIIAYDNPAKADLLGVEPAQLQEYGAVSREVAQAMAQGALLRLDADMALATTGMAGDEAAPSAVIYVGAATKALTPPARHFPSTSDRDSDRLLAATTALELALEMLAH